MSFLYLQVVIIRFTDMSAKAVFIICVQALLFQGTLSQYISRAAVDTSGIGFFGWRGSIAPGFTYDGLVAPYGFNRLAALNAFGLAAPYGYNTIASSWGYEAPYAYDGFNDWAGRSLGYGSIYPSIAAAIETTPTTSCGFIVTSSSPVAPTGISVVTDTGFDGILAVAGDAPFVGTSGMEGVLPTVGSGAINHAYGNRLNAMVSETVFAPAVSSITITPSWAPATAYGYGSGLIY